MSNLRTLFLAAAAASIAGTANAGGVAPTPIPPPVVVAPAAFNWSGGYVGGHLGVAQGQYSNEGLIAPYPGDGEGDLDGFLLGLTGGYAFQSGNIVYGGEANIAFADITGAEPCLNVAVTCAVEINMLASLRGNVGVLINPDTLISANLGLAVANANVFVDGGAGPIGTEDLITGFTFGVGFERALSSNLSVSGSIQSYDFQPADFQTDILYSDVDINVQTIEIGLNYRF